MFTFNAFVGIFGRSRRQARKASADAAAPRPAGVSIKRLDGNHGRRLRESQPIAAYVGVNGSGKTLAMVHDTLPALYSGRRIYTTVPLYIDGVMPDNVELLTDWSQILDARHADILLDEVSAICSSRDTLALPPQIATLLQQLRKHDLRLRWTAPNWQRADRILRETTKTVTICRGMFPHRDPHSDWRQNTLFVWRTFDSADYTDFTSLDSAKKRLKPLQTAFYLLTSRSLAPKTYDTFASVSTIGTVLESGRCAVCGGRRRVPECTCSDYVLLKRQKEHSAS